MDMEAEDMGEGDLTGVAKVVQASGKVDTAIEKVEKTLETLETKIETVENAMGTASSGNYKYMWDRVD